MKRLTPGTTGRGGAGCLTVFGSVFLLVGLGALGLAARQVWWHVQAAQWVETSATVLSASLDSSTDDEGSTTYRALGRYRYQVNGQFYESERISFSVGHDNIGSFQRNAFDILERHRRSGEALVIRVNPDDPGEAVAFTTLRWGMLGFLLLFGLVFGGVGVAIVLGGRYAGRAGAREAERALAHPEEPWRWRDQWQNATMISDDRQRLKLSAGFAVFWNLVSLPAMFAVPREVLEKGNYAALLALLFPLVGVGLIVWAVRSYLQWKRFGHSELILQTFPARLGGSLAATLRCASAQLPMNTELELVLSCVRRERTRSGKDRSTQETILWQDSQRLAVTGANSPLGLEQAVRFQIPADAAASDWEDPNDGVIWRLEASADIPGVDYSAQFELPVVAAEDTGDPAPQPGYLTAQVGTGDVDEGDWTRSGVVHEVTAAGRRYYFPAARHPSIALMLTLMTVVFGGAGVFIVHTNSTFFGGIFVVIGALLGVSALHTALHRSEVVVTGSVLRFRRGWLRLGAAREFRREDINRLRLTSSMSSGNRRYYDIVLETSSGTRTKLANSLSGKRDTQQLIQRISGDLGVRY